jgi:hypothetical protein
MHVRPIDIAGERDTMAQRTAVTYNGAMLYREYAPARRAFYFFTSPESVLGYFHMAEAYACLMAGRTSGRIAA